MNLKRCIIVLPAYNEAEHLPEVLRSLQSNKYEFIVVDDGSSDQTARLAKRFTPFVLRHRVNIGKGAALKTGCEFAFERLGAEAVIFMDADSQHTAASLPLFFQGLKAGFPVVLGERMFTSKMPLIKIFGNRFASFLVYLLFGTYIPDIPSGFKAMTKWGYQRVVWQSVDYRVELEIAVNLAKKNVRFITVPIETIYLDYERGFQFLDAVGQVLSVFSWRLSK